MLDEGYLTELQNWRQQLDDTLRGEQSWLALVGLYWLEQGKNSFGSHDSNDVVFPDGSTPKHLGDFELRDERVYLHVEHGNGILVDGEQVVDQELKLEGFDQPSEINVGSLTMIVVQRGERFGLRVWDRNNPRRKTFPGRIWYEPDESHLVKTTISTYDPPREMPITIYWGIQAIRLWRDTWNFSWMDKRVGWMS